MNNIEILAYLDSVRHLYSGGVPLDLLGGVSNNDLASDKLAESRGSKELIVAGNLEGSLTLIVVEADLSADSSGVPFVGKTGELLRNIIEKGLKMDLLQVCVIASKDTSTLEKHLNGALMQKLKSTTILVMGRAAGHTLLKAEIAENQLGRFHKLDGSHVLVTYSLSEVGSSATKKRLFWNHLKSVMERL
ncbi:MAG: hypothetical protein KDD42_02865 [Bdellovibrionales bacterium]|nr:hypothetical protein [Bdellovibrionales bacterium]